MNSSVTMFVAGDYRRATPVLFAEVDGRDGFDNGQRSSLMPLSLPFSRTVQKQPTATVKSRHGTAAVARPVCLMALPSMSSPGNENVRSTPS